MSVVDAILEEKRGLIVAPAGCGKTHSIMEAVARHQGKPCLVLTHTNAGAAALRRRLSDAKIPHSRYRLSTLDGWSLKLVTTFPLRSGYIGDKQESPNYPDMRIKAAELLNSGAVSDIIASTYGRVLVDEYQDCSPSQHLMATLLADLLPCCILGDPLQAIFTIGGSRLVDWNEVQNSFPEIAELKEPMRWRRVGEEKYGEWLLHMRQELIHGNSIDLAKAPVNVTWQQLHDDERDDAARHEAGRQHKMEDGERLLVIGPSNIKGSLHRYGRMVHGVTVVEPVELGDLIDCAQDMAKQKGKRLLETVLNFASDVATGVEVQKTLTRVESLVAGRAKKQASAEEVSAIALMKDGGADNALRLLHLLMDSGERRVFRRYLMMAMFHTLERVIAAGNSDYVSAAIAVREQERHCGRRLPWRGVGSTLLLKGLEAEHGLILDAAHHDQRNFYVAMTRASKSLKIFSKDKILRPAE